MSLQFKTESIEVDNKIMFGALAELDNAVLCIIWMGEPPKLGSMTATLPNKTSGQLLGERDEVLSRMIGEKLVSRYGKMVLVSSHLPPGYKAGKDILELIKKLSGA
jgi:hypothetical protein